MSLAVFQDVSLSFGKKTIVEGLDLRLADGDRVGLVGPNGSGKTSLLRLLAGEQAPDGGKIELRRGLRVGYLPQDIALEGGRELLAFVRDSVPGREKLDEGIAELEAQLDRAQREHADEAELMELATALSELHERASHYETHYSEHEAMRILAGLGFTLEDHGRDLSELSGGWKMRAVLAALLFQKPDLLLLDEPTNHLDMPSVSWFAEFLLRYKGAFILICHDREFLNEQIARVVTFEPEGVRQYGGNYEAYLRQRAEEEVILENKAKNLAREREQAERFITRFRAQASKARAVQSRVKALEKLDDVVTFEKRQVMRFRFPAAARGAAEPIVLRGVGKAYGDHQVLSGVDLTVRRGEKIGIIGVNGAGKTTLLRMMAGEIPVSAGTIEIGHNIKVGYYAQHHAESLDRGLDIYTTVAQENAEAGMTRVRTLLGAFLFKDDDVEKKVAVLSGGERARVALARLLINPGNLLLMDEPTNHLDLESSEALAESLSSYDGTLVFVSHNRSFVRRLATRIWNVADGTVDTYPGTLDEYMDSSRRRLEEASSPSAPAEKAAPAREPQAPQEPKGKKRGSRAEEKERKRREAEARQARTDKRKLEREVAKLEAEITRLEVEQRERSEALADPDVYADADKSGELIEAFKDGQQKLESLQARWERALGALEAE